MATRVNPDAVIVNHGSLFRVIPWTDAGRAWVNRYIGQEAQTRRPGFVVEGRYLQAIVQAMQTSGLLVLPAAPRGQHAHH